jgi:quercetin dioxygenase-like cupin family protein
MDIPDAVKLTLPVDAAALAEDVRRLPESDWMPHFNSALYEGDWSGISLRSVGGRADTIYPDPAAAEPFADTEVLARCPAIAATVAAFHCDLQAVRLLRLGPGARVAEHRDYRLGYEDGELRVHVPVISGPDAEFVLNGHVLPMVEGDCWYVNVNRPHRVANNGQKPRVHLVVDCVLNDWLQDRVFRSFVNSPTSA